MSDGAKRSRDEGGAIDAAVRAWAAEERSVREHPEPEELVDYQEGRFDADRVERLGRHLLGCSACREQIRLLYAFDREVPQESEPLASEEVTERAWQRFQAARDSMRSHGRLGPRRWPRRARWLVAVSTSLGLAASVLLAVVLVGPARPGGSAGGGSPFVFDLDPAGISVDRDASMAEEVVVPPGMGPLVAVLNLGDLTAHERYQVEIYGAETRPVLERRDLARDRLGRVTFLLERGELPAGDYRVLLVALDCGERGDLATYLLRLRYAP